MYRGSRGKVENKEDMEDRMRNTMVSLRVLYEYSILEGKKSWNKIENWEPRELEDVLGSWIKRVKEEEQRLKVEEL